MDPVKIKEDIYWIGALDPHRTVFDIIMPLDRGTTYNSYLVKGEKIAIIEAVKIGFEGEFLSNIRSLIDPGEIDYVILNHLEPDHSGALATLLAEAPQAEVVVSRSGEHYVNNLLNREVKPLKMGDGDSLDLGGKTLQFIWAPFLHWPDTMFTYLVEEKVLFPCDFLGCHFCDQRLYDDLVDDFSHQFRYYFDTIMRPFKGYALKALDKISGLEIELIAPSHGPILRTSPRRYIDLYREWSSLPKPGMRKLALVFYVSAYGNTAKMAGEIAKGVEAGGAEAESIDLEEANPPDLLDKIEAAQGLIIGSPTINGDAVKPVWDLLSSLTTLKVKGKVGAAFGSYGWSGEAVGMIEERLRSLKLKLPEPGLKFVLVPTADELEQGQEFGRKIAQAL